MDNEELNWKEFYKRANLFQRADAVSIKVGLVLTPLLFGGAGAGILHYMDPPASYWVGCPFFVAGVLLFLFILMYAKRAKNKKPYALVGDLVKVIKYQTQFSETTRLLQINVSEAYELTPEGKGRKIEDLTNTEVKKLFVLRKNQAENEVRSTGDNTIFLCSPNGQVVSFVINGELTEHLY